MKKKVWLSAAAIALVLCCAVGGTLAWLSAKTDPINNTFTVGDISIQLAELDGSYRSGRRLLPPGPGSRRRCGLSCP